MSDRRMEKRLFNRLAGSFAVAMLAVACSSAEPTTMDRSTFIQVIVDLRTAGDEALDAADFQLRKAEILSEAGVTDSMLVAFSSVHGTDARFMAAVWDSIDRTLNPVDTDGEEPDDAHSP